MPEEGEKGAGAWNSPPCTLRGDGWRSHGIRSAHSGPGPNPHGTGTRATPERHPLCHGTGRSRKLHATRLVWHEVENALGVACLPPAFARSGARTASQRGPALDSRALLESRGCPPETLLASHLTRPEPLCQPGSGGRGGDGLGAADWDILRGAMARRAEADALTDDIAACLICLAQGTRTQRCV